MKVFKAIFSARRQGKLQWRAVLHYKTSRSFIALFLGCSSILAGLILFLCGMFGSTSWTDRTLAAPIEVSDAAPGSALIIAGFFIVAVACFKFRAKGSPAPNKLQTILTPSPKSPVSSIERIVAKAVQEAKKTRWSSFSIFLNEKIDEDGIIVFRNYFEPYFKDLNSLTEKIGRDDAERVSRLLNKFFVETALKQVLDAWYASFLIHDLVLNLLESVREKGGDIHKVSIYLEYLQLSWEQTRLAATKPPTDRKCKFARQLLSIHGRLLEKEQAGFQVHAGLNKANTSQ